MASESVNRPILAEHLELRPVEGRDRRGDRQAAEDRRRGAPNLWRVDGHDPTEDLERGLGSALRAGITALGRLRAIPKCVLVVGHQKQPGEWSCWQTS